MYSQNQASPTLAVAFTATYKYTCLLTLITSVRYYSRLNQGCNETDSICQQQKMEIKFQEISGARKDRVILEWTCIQEFFLKLYAGTSLSNHKNHKLKQSRRSKYDDISNKTEVQRQRINHQFK